MKYTFENKCLNDKVMSKYLLTSNSRAKTSNQINKNIDQLKKIDNIKPVKYLERTMTKKN